MAGAHGVPRRAQTDQTPRWGIYQKQTGADRLSLAGALACNAHGRGLNLKPIVEQVEEFDLLGADGEIRTCRAAFIPICSAWRLAATGCSGS